MADVSVEGIVSVVIVVGALLLFVVMFSGLVHGLSADDRQYIISSENAIAIADARAQLAYDATYQLANENVGFFGRMMQLFGLEPDAGEVALAAKQEVLDQKAELLRESVTGWNGLITRPELVDVPFTHNETHDTTIMTILDECTLVDTNQSTDVYSQETNENGTYEVYNHTDTIKVGTHWEPCKQQTPTAHDTVIVDSEVQYVFLPNGAYTIVGENYWCYQDDTDGIIRCKDGDHADGWTHTKQVNNPGYQYYVIQPDGSMKEHGIFPIAEPIIDEVAS